MSYPAEIPEAIFGAARTQVESAWETSVEDAARAMAEPGAQIPKKSDIERLMVVPTIKHLLTLVLARKRVAAAFCDAQAAAIARLDARVADLEREAKRVKRLGR